MVEQTLRRSVGSERTRSLDRTFSPDFAARQRRLALLTQAQGRIDANFQDWKALDAVIVLGATMDFDRERNRWRLGGLINSDVSSPLVGGLSRAAAIAQLHREGFSGVVAVTGGTQVAEGSKASRAERLASSIRSVGRKDGAEESKVVAIGREGHGNTLGNVADTIDFLKRQGIYRQIGLVTNDWHILRTLLTFMDNPYFDDHGITIWPVIADELLRRRSPLHAQWVDAFNAHPAMGERVRMERQGIQDFLDGSYSPLSS